MMAQDFFRDAFVFAKRQTSRAASGKRHALHLEERNDVLVEPRIIFELLDQIEKNVRLEAFHLLPDKIDIVEDGEMLGGVTEFAERRHHVRLGLPILRFHLLAQVLVDLGRTNAVEKDEDFEFLFHARYLVRLNLPVKR